LNPDKTSLKTFFIKEEPLSKKQWPNGVSQREIFTATEDLWEESSESALAFVKASPSILPLLSKTEFKQWLRLGRSVLNEPSGTPDLCQEYFRSSSALLCQGSFHQLNGWLEQGLQVAECSPSTALQYFRSTPEFLNHVKVVNLRAWAGWAMQILATGDIREEAANTFFKSSVEFSRFISFRELKDWTAAGLQIARHSADLASTFFSHMPDELESLYVSERLEIFQLTSMLAKVNPAGAIEFYQGCPAALLRLCPTIRTTVLKTTRKFSADNPENIAGTFDEIVSSLATLSYPIQENVMEHEDSLWRISSKTARIYLKHAGRLLEQIPETFLSHWIKKGVSLLLKDEQNGFDYFSLQSRESQRELDRWKEAVLLEDHRRLLSFLAHALSGKEMRLRSTEELDAEVSPRVRHYPATDGQTIYLPPLIASERKREDNFRVYKVATAHQAGYIEFGTFESGFNPIMEILQTFPSKALVMDIFFILEDGRVDHSLRREYRGLREEIDQVISEAMKKRTDLECLPLQEALVEVLLRLTTGFLDETLLPEEILKHAVYLKNTLAGFYEQARGVWDCFSKTLQIYDYLSQLPPSPSYLPYVPLFFRGILDPDLMPGAGPWKSPPDEIIDELGNGEGVIPMSADELKKLLESIKDLSKLKFLDAEEPFSDGLFITGADISAKAAINDPHTENHEAENRPLVKITPRSTGQDGPFYYDEWDYLAKAYRKRWCCLREKKVEPLDPEIIDEIYANYNNLIQKVKKQFQRIRPELLDISRRMDWGDEIDLPLMIQGVVDRIAGSSPSDKIFTRREKKIRKISTLLLIDMSASTDELVPCSQNPNHPSQKTLSSPKSNNKKIIDIEIESLVVLMEALNALDDDYAIFGFSGSGREKVDFYNIKDFGDSYSETLKRRIAGIHPKQSTRMGPAIRHAITKLSSVESDQRLLILLSDGFPQDQDYGEDRRSNEYGLHDTMMALLEAKKEGIRAFCITVDQSGNDYLRKMCDPNNYLVIKDIHSLPETLPRVVESLMG